MRILIDTNVLISATLNPDSTPFQAYVKASSLFKVLSLKHTEISRPML